MKMKCARKAAWRRVQRVRILQISEFVFNSSRNNSNNNHKTHLLFGFFFFWVLFLLLFCFPFISSQKIAAHLRQANDRC